MARSSFFDSDSSRRSRYFFKIFFPEQSTLRLRIPPAFRRHVEDYCPGRFSLKGPSGNVWCVRLVRDSNELFLEEGWKEFAADHSMVTGDFLVFRYDRRFCFTVLVFDATACEKEGALSARPCREETTGFLEGLEEFEFEEDVKPFIVSQDGRVQSSSKRKEGMDELLSTMKKSLKRKKYISLNGRLNPDSRALSVYGHSPSSSSESSRGTRRTFPVKGRSVEHIANNRRAKSELWNGRVSKTSSHSNKTVLVKVNKMHQEGKVAGKALRIGGLLSQRRPVTEEEINRTLQMAKSFKSKHPSVVVIMQDSYVYTSFFLNIPSPFVREHLSKANKVLTLWDSKGMPWKITLVTYDNGGRGAFSGGWAKFSYVHNLEKYDVCVFEQIKRNHLRAHIFRVVEEIKPLIRITRQNCYLA